MLDTHLETQRLLDFTELEGFTSISQGPVVGAYKMTCKFGDRGSSLVRYTILRANSSMLEYYLTVDWKESRKHLKVEFPLNILTRNATFEVQFGHVERPSHMNTSWEMPKYEVCGHK
jgi:alpha-mannosidase